MDNKEIFRNNSSAESDGVASAITGSTSNDVSDGNKSDKNCKENCEPRTAESSPNSTTTISTRAADVLEGTGSTSSDGHKQHVVDMQSNFAVDKPLIKQNQDAKRENVIRRDVENTEDDDCNVTLVAEAPNTLHSREERLERNTEESVTVDQSFENESANSEAVSSKHTSDDGDTENSQTCTCTLNNYGVAEKVSRDVSEKSEDSNDTSLNKVVDGVTEQSQGGNNVPREESDLENNSLQDHPSLKGNEDYILKMDAKNESVLAEHGEIKGSDLPEVSTGDDSDWQSGEKLVGQVVSCSESDLITSKGDSVNSESGEVLAVCDAGRDCLNLKEEKGEDKEITHEQVTLDSLHSTCLTENRELESQNSAIGLSNSSQKIDESDTQLGKTEEKIQVLSDYTKGSSESAVMESNQESNQSVGQLQAELPKTPSSKKKKSKKEKCKEGEEKTKSKGKSEKKKKREKKSDSEQIVDSERKVKEGKKSRSKEPCTKEQKTKTKDSKTCREDSAQRLPTETKGVRANDCGDGSGDDDDDDDDNWELNFDESGDCLKPEHLEEVCFVDLHTEATSTTSFIYKRLSHTLGYHSSLLYRGSFIKKRNEKLEMGRKMEMEKKWHRGQWEE